LNELRGDPSALPGPLLSSLARADARVEQRVHQIEDRRCKAYADNDEEYDPIQQVAVGVADAGGQHPDSAHLLDQHSA